MKNDLEDKMMAAAIAAILLFDSDESIIKISSNEYFLDKGISSTHVL